MKKRIFNILFLSILLLSCSAKTTSGYIEVGFTQTNNSHQVFTPRISIGVKTKKAQELSNVSFDVYPGAIKSFEKDWENYFDNPHNGRFYVKLQIFELGKVIGESFFKLDDFPNQDKFLVTHKAVEGYYDRWTTKFKDYLTFSINFTQYSAKNALKLEWYITYCDDFENKINYDDLLAGFVGGRDVAVFFMKIEKDAAILSDTEFKKR